MSDDELLAGERWCDHCGAILGPGSGDCEVLPDLPTQMATCSYTHQSGKKRTTKYPVQCLTPAAN